MTDRPIHEIPLDADDGDLSFLAGISSAPADKWQMENGEIPVGTNDSGVSSASAMPLQYPPMALPMDAPLIASVFSAAPPASVPPSADARLTTLPPPARPTVPVASPAVNHGFVAPPAVPAIRTVSMAPSAEGRAFTEAAPTLDHTRRLSAPPAAATPLIDMPAPVEVAPAPALAPLTAAAPVSHEILDVLHQLVRIGGSDLHVSKNAPPMIRVDGDLRPAEGSEIWSADRVARALASVASPAQLAIFEEHRELDFAFALTEQSRFRVNFYQQRGTIGAAFRLIPTEIKRLDDLGVPAIVNKFSTLPRGLVLVTGPTGSGKSTTLAALIDLVNETRADHIMTVEDPIEFVHKNKRSLVNQREVGDDTKSFQNALKHVLRQDPDVILIGELRDLETISTALTAAETGHLVFATLHTQDAGQTIDRIIDVFPPFQQGQVRQQLAATLQGVVCQTLVKRASGKGRAVATEVLIATPAIANLIREGKTYQIGSAMQAGRGMGMYTMDQHLAELVNAGTITMTAATEKAHDLDTLQRLVSRKDGAALDPMADYLQSESTGGH